MLFSKEGLDYSIEQFELEEETESSLIVPLGHELDRLESNLDLTSKLTESTYNASLHDGLSDTGFLVLEEAMNTLRGNGAYPSIDISRVNNSNRAFMTNLVHEGFIDSIKELLAKLMDFIKSIFDKLIELVKSIWNCLNDKKRINDDLEKQLKSKKGLLIRLGNEDYYHKFNTIDKPILFKAFQHNGKVEACTVQAIMDNHKTLSDKSIQSGTTTLTAISEISSILKSDITSKDIDQLHDSVVTVAAKTSVKGFKFDKLIYGTVVKVHEDFSEEGVEFEVIRPRSDVAIKPVPILDLHTVKTLVNCNKDLIHSLEEIKYTETALVHTKDNALSACRVALHSLQFDDPNEQQRASIKLNLIRRIMKQKISAAIKLISVVPRLTNEALSQSQEYCKVSLQKHE